MRHKIKAGGMFVSHSLEVGPGGVVFVETALFGGKTHLRFDQIDLILMSPAHVLSLESRGEVYSVPVKPSKESHTAAIEALVRAVRATAPGAGSPE